MLSASAQTFAPYMTDARRERITLWKQNWSLSDNEFCEMYCLNRGRFAQWLEGAIEYLPGDRAVDAFLHVNNIPREVQSKTSRLRLQSIIDELASYTFTSVLFIDSGNTTNNLEEFVKQDPTRCCIAFFCRDFHTSKIAELAEEPNFFYIRGTKRVPNAAFVTLAMAATMCSMYFNVGVSFQFFSDNFAIHEVLQNTKMLSSRYCEVLHREIDFF